jgi:photosystem II stability/assembly factor-like uncharacterized protein
LEQRPRFDSRARRALPLIAAALTAIVVAGLLYLRATEPPPRVILRSGPPIPQLGSGFRVDYDFVTPRDGWAVVAKYVGVSEFWIYRTTDGAQHWVREFSGPITQGAPVSIQFFDRVHGIAQLDRVYRTEDGGSHWTRISVPDDSPDLVFVNPSLGWALDARQLYTTVDGGLTWQTGGLIPQAFLNTGKGGAFGPLQFRATGEGWAGATADQPTVYTTADGGKTWRPIVLRAFPRPPVAGKPYFTETFVGLVPGGVLAMASDDFGNGRAYASFDGGRSWRSIQLPPRIDQGGGSFSLVETRLWFASSSGLLYRSSDAGTTWISIPTITALTMSNWVLGTIHMIDARQGWAASTLQASTAGSGLAMTSDGGVHWTPVDVPRPG